MPILLKLAAGTAGTMLLAGSWVVHEGAVRIAVDETPDGREPTHIHLLLPATFVPAVLHLVPTGHLQGALAQARPWMPAAEAACEELAKLPDTDLVEVRDSSEHVRIRTRSGHLVIDVDGPRDTVHVSFPLRTAWKVAREIEQIRPES